MKIYFDICCRNHSIKTKKAMPEAVRWQINLLTMSWFSSTEDYSINDNGFYGEPEITYGSDDTSSSSSSSSASGAWGDYQHECQYLGGLIDDQYSR